jgi:UDP-N-acetylmuramate: L-alanyl-gamma-D-glutamyl-meso-diaminopimelate ligase
MRKHVICTRRQSPPRARRQQISTRLNKVTEHIHVLGIAGSAMAPVAGMLKERGFHVTGSDVNVYPPASTLLDSLGIRWNEGFRAENLQPAPDLCVVGNVIARGNPEIEHILDEKLPYCSMPQLLEQYFIPGHTSIVVAGTHGKTTTTAMLAWIFQVAGRKPDFLVGGISPNFGDRSYGLGGGESILSHRNFWTHRRM